MNQIAVIAQQYWDNEHMVRHGGRLWLCGLAIVLVVVAVVALAVWLSTRASHPHGHGAAQDDSGARARGILAERYARGEITTEEYQERLTVLR